MPIHNTCMDIFKRFQIESDISVLFFVVDTLYNMVNIARNFKHFAFQSSTSINTRTDPLLVFFGSDVVHKFTYRRQTPNNNKTRLIQLISNSTSVARFTLESNCTLTLIYLFIFEQRDSKWFLLAFNKTKKALCEYQLYTN